MLEQESSGKVFCSFCLVSDHALPLFAHGASDPGVGAEPRCPGWQGEAGRVPGTGLGVLRRCKRCQLRD